MNIKTIISILAILLCIQTSDTYAKLLQANTSITYIQNTNPSLTIEEYNRIIHSNPKNSNAYVERGIAYFDQGQLDLAIKDYDRALLLN
jgi:tetratricopeptide (TPR) repeat protein